MPDEPNDATQTPIPPDDRMTVSEALINPATFVEGMRAVTVWTQVVAAPYHYVSAVVAAWASSGKWRAACERGSPGETVIRCFDERTLRLVQQRFRSHLPKKPA